MAPRHDGTGYWVVDRAGHVFSYGTAGFFGGSPALGAGEFVSTISATPNGGGYWLFTNQGRVFPFGNAAFFGDMSGAHLNGPIVASVATPTGQGLLHGRFRRRHLQLRRRASSTARPAICT